jgi:uncharacterized protein (DUF427 family)
MALTLGTSPFADPPAGKLSFQLPRSGVLYFEDYPRRIRARFGGQTVVDSKRVKLLHETGRLPVFYFPEADVRMDLLEKSGRTESTERRGRAVYSSIRCGEQAAADVAWSHPDPGEGGLDLAGYIAFTWEPMEAWLEEDESLVGHARDPYHRIDVLDTSRKIRISVHGEVVAETERSRVLFESGLPPRWYIRRDDVRIALLPSDKHTTCAYKGLASYFSVRAGGVLEKDLIWYYPEPRHDALRVKDWLCFFNERVDLEIDGALEHRPRTEWSPAPEQRRK